MQKKIFMLIKLARCIMKITNQEEQKLFEEMYAKCVEIVKANQDLGERSERSQVACVIVGESGKMYTGLNVGWWHSSCAEHIALSNAWQGGERKMKYMMALKLNKRNGELQSIAPCGICREMFNNLQPDIKVVVYDTDGYFKIYTIPQVLPDIDDF
jgi:cytidine deaminase